MPIMILEVAAGRLSEGSTVATYRQVGRFGTFYGWFLVLVTVAVTSYFPPHRIRTVLGTANRWWEWRVYLVGRYLPVLVVVWALIVFARNQI
ncbi:hypothetical protein C8D92_10215 [Tamilnaduibacter salinus]|uniref:Uncharacterized protein n=2 Tax=Tamilnaduibacter salinus TaxID=1484056 RepID=A0A2U1CYY6_9GAMM|nr:hypothetical protein C8D92_10215 [Tamilnaduibacter salinus]